MKETSSTASDPRQPSTARSYVPPTVSPQDLPIDYAGFFAVIFGVTGVMLRYKLCSWLAIIFCAQSLANMKNLENDLKQISMAMIYTLQFKESARVFLSEPMIRRFEN
ncbi:protein Asterix [Cocos nucifera]|uniref:Protein Asterix n=1 Tax=Cocos nucifera TaxID=13894 RepID=A0A8K0ICN3_COCNU|nr:protein Asterix [Cocos nucifera]